MTNKYRRVTKKNNQTNTIKMQNYWRDGEWPQRNRKCSQTDAKKKINLFIPRGNAV